LFGHVKGAFTGAGQARTGLLSLAEGGTLFLDELADIPLPVQVKLLRALEHGEVFPVGSTTATPLNLRFLTATNQDLARCVSEGKFRHDLYYRLNVFQVHLPPLRERPEDIEPLANHFLGRFRPQALPLLPETLRYLRAQPWFGNVRELRNALEHAAILAREGALLSEHFPQLALDPTAQTPAQQLSANVRQWLADKLRAAGNEPPQLLYEELLRIIEPALLEDVIRRLKGNRWVAAQWLGLNRATVRKKLGVYGLADVDGEDEGTNED
jgi:two-component system nitrogen regulation response regulator GlnG